MMETTVDQDLDGLTLTFTCVLDAPVDRCWQLWADPRQIERWWGPPMFPATFTTHEIEPGGTVRYVMTGPDGAQFHGLWTVVEVAAPGRLVFDDRFADDDGNPVADMPTTHTTVELHADGPAATRMVITSVFESREAMDRLIEMQMVEGMRQALSQIPAVLAA